MTNEELIQTHLRDTGLCSVWHHAKQVSTTYQQIIDKGQDIIPSLLKILEEEEGGMHLMFLLTDITNEWPYKPETPGHWKVAACREAWIKWGKQRYSK